MFQLLPLGANDPLSLVFDPQHLAQGLLEQTLNPFLMDRWMNELMSTYSTFCLWVTVLGTKNFLDSQRDAGEGQKG